MLVQEGREGVAATSSHGPLEGVQSQAMCCVSIEVTFMFDIRAKVLTIINDWRC